MKVKVTANTIQEGRHGTFKKGDVVADSKIPAQILNRWMHDGAAAPVDEAPPATRNKGGK